MPARRHHPTLPPSSFPAFSKCPRYRGSLTVGAAAVRGTRIGATIEEMATGEKQDEAYDPEFLRANEPLLLNEIEWIFSSLHVMYNGLAGVEIEQEIPILDDNFEEVTFGTADYYRDGHLSDLKTGEKRSYIEQMAVLSLGFMDRDGIETMTVSLLWSKFREVETWTWSRAQVEAIVWAIINSVRQKLPPRPNSYCSWCRDKETCSARVKAVSALPLNMPTTGDLRDYLDTITPADRAAFIRQIQIAKKWCEDAETAVEDWFLADPEAHVIEGFKLGKTNPKRVWADEAAAAIALQAKAVEMGGNPALLVETHIVTAARIKAVLGHGKGVKDLVDSLLTKPEGKPALVEDWAPGKKNPNLPDEQQAPIEQKENA